VQSSTYEIPEDTKCINQLGLSPVALVCLKGAEVWLPKVVCCPRNTALEESTSSTALLPEWEAVCWEMGHTGLSSTSSCEDDNAIGTLLHTLSAPSASPTAFKETEMELLMMVLILSS
jgi:hypothetical protein